MSLYKAGTDGGSQLRLSANKRACPAQRHYFESPPLLTLTFKHITIILYHVMHYKKIYIYP